MHYGLFTYGSRGDVQPYIALAIGLQNQGHQVSLSAPGNFRDFVEGYGISFYPLYGNADELLQTPAAQKALEGGNLFSLLRILQKEGRVIQPLVNRDLLAWAEHCDVLITSLLCHFWVACIAEKQNKKWGVVAVNFPTTPTKTFPFAGLALMNNRWYNRISHRMAQSLYWKLNKKDVNRFRKELSLPPIHHNLLHDVETKNILNLFAISPSVIPQPTDWPGNSHLCGYLTLPSKNRAANPGDAAPPGLIDWLQQGEPPVYIGLGSMPLYNSDHFRNLLMELVETSNHRILFCKGWSGIEDLPGHPNLFIVGQVNHEWLLPQCKVAVIHGGAGTTAAVLRAGIPAIITSLFGDQPWWGKIIGDRKVGIHLPFKKLSSKKLLEAIDQTQTNLIRNSARELGEKMQLEDGLEKAIKRINRYFY